MTSFAARAQLPDADLIFPVDSRVAAQAGGANLLEVICPGNVTTGAEIECRTGCPAYTGFGDSKGSLTWSLTTVTLGHFLSPTSDDAALSMLGCEPHAANYGGTILLTRRAQGWSMLWYKAGINTSFCHKVPLAGGREILVCFGMYGAQGNDSNDLDVEDLRAPAAVMAEGQSFFSTSDNTGTCGLNADDMNKPNPTNPHPH